MLPSISSLMNRTQNRANEMIKTTSTKVLGDVRYSLNVISVTVWLSTVCYLKTFFQFALFLDSTELVGLYKIYLHYYGNSSFEFTVKMSNFHLLMIGIKKVCYPFRLQQKPFQIKNILFLKFGRPYGTCFILF